MNDPKLSRREQVLLDGIEEDLRSDESLGQRLRTLGRGGTRPTRAGGLLRSRLGLWTMCLGVVCVALFIPAVAASSPRLLWLFAAVWVVTVVCLIRFLQSRHHRRASAWPRRRTH
ncbi:hypothetical protein ABTX77_39495 [Streptomyces sp. NPDC097704]|uniref:hypothetical protein n=1 Tax=Streptomyces sp. NPDC097704 TaxID=3157101 RepID=UPI00331D5974